MNAALGAREPVRLHPCEPFGMVGGDFGIPIHDRSVAVAPGAEHVPIQRSHSSVGTLWVGELPYGREGERDEWIEE